MIEDLADWLRRATKAFAEHGPLALALTWLLVVFGAAATWNFSEQERLAETWRFTIPWLLPLFLDGMPFSLASVAWAATLRGRSAPFARIGIVLTLAASSAASGYSASQRTHGAAVAVALAAGAPLFANLAFEVLLSEIRVRARGGDRRGKVLLPNMLHLLLAPRATWSTWRYAQLAPVRALAAAQAGEQHPLLDEARKLFPAPSGNQVALKLRAAGFEIRNGDATLISQALGAAA